MRREGLQGGNEAPGAGDDIGERQGASTLPSLEAATRHRGGVGGFSVSEGPPPVPPGPRSPGDLLGDAAERWKAA